MDLSFHYDPPVKLDHQEQIPAPEMHLVSLARHISGRSGKMLFRSLTSTTSTYAAAFKMVKTLSIASVAKALQKNLLTAASKPDYESIYKGFEKMRDTFKIQAPIRTRAKVFPEETVTNIWKQVDDVPDDELGTITLLSMDVRQVDRLDADSLAEIATLTAKLEDLGFLDDLSSWVQWLGSQSFRHQGSLTATSVDALGKSRRHLTGSIGPDQIEIIALKKGFFDNPNTFKITGNNKLSPAGERVMEELAENTLGGLGDLYSGARAATDRTLSFTQVKRLEAEGKVAANTITRNIFTTFRGDMLVVFHQKLQKKLIDALQNKRRLIQEGADEIQIATADALLKQFEASKNVIVRNMGNNPQANGKLRKAMGISYTNEPRSCFGIPFLPKCNNFVDENGAAINVRDRAFRENDELYDNFYRTETSANTGAARDRGILVPTRRFGVPFSYPSPMDLFRLHKRKMLLAGVGTGAYFMSRYYVCDLMDTSNEFLGCPDEGTKDEQMTAEEIECMKNCCPKNMPQTGRVDGVPYAVYGISNGVSSEGLPVADLDKDGEIAVTSSTEKRFPEFYPIDWHLTARNEECKANPVQTNIQKKDAWYCPIYHEEKDKLYTKTTHPVCTDGFLKKLDTGEPGYNCISFCDEMCRTVTVRGNDLDNDEDSNYGDGSLCEFGDPCPSLFNESTIMFVAIGVAILIVIFMFTSRGGNDDELDFED